MKHTDNIILNDEGLDVFFKIMNKNIRVPRLHLWNIALELLAWEIRQENEIRRLDWTGRSATVSVCG